MTTYTTNLKLTQPALNATGWGTTVNNGITALVDDAVAGLVSVDVAGGNVTLTTANGVADQARNMFIRAYNASVARDIIVPALTKLYFVINDCTAAVTFKVSGQTGVAVPAGKTAVLRCDGTDIVPAVTFLTPGVEISGSSSSDMLRITQTGSGNAFVVEDSTSPDSSPFVIDATGDVGIGTSTPTEKLEVYGSSPYILINNTSETEAGIKFVDSADPTTQIAVISYDSGTPNVLRFAVDTVERLAISDSGTTTLSGSAASVLVLDRSNSVNTVIELKNTSGSMFIGNSDGTTFAVDDDNNLSDAPRFTVTNEGATRINANTASDALLITQAGAGPALRITGDSTSAISRISSTSSGASTFDGSGAGVEITANSMNTTSKYTPALKFGSTDSDFTTTNPKFGAAILAEAVQTYSSDTTGGMNLLFWTSPVSPGTGNGLVERMKITSSGNLIVSTGNVGIGTATPTEKLEVYGTSPYILISNDDETSGGIKFADVQAPTTQNAAIEFDSGTPSLAFSINNSEALRITSTGDVGIGISTPETLLHVYGSSASAIARISSTGSGGTTFDGSGAGVEITAGSMSTTSKYTPALKFGSTDADFTTTNPKFGAAILAEAAETFSADTAGGMNLLFWTSPTNPGTGNGLVERMRINSEGNVGIGATPEAWDSQWTAIDIKGASGIFAFNSVFDPAIISGVNVYVDGSSSTANAKYKVSSEQASMYRQYQGVHAWFTAPTGTADTAITFTQAMTLTAAGNLGIGTASPAVALDVSGAVRASTGVLFGTDTATANTLDDYEEGTWTPVVADATTGGNVASAGTFSGSYTRVGRIVTITCLAVNIGTSGMTSGNDVYVRGLPFTAASFSNTQMFTGAMLLTNTAITTQTAANLIDNTAYVRISENLVGAGFDYVTVGELTSTASDIYFTITYEAA